MEGLIFLVLTVAGVRTALMRAISVPIKVATMSGVGLLLGIIGFQSAGLVVSHPATMVTLGNLRSVDVLLPLGGVVPTGALIVRGVRGAILAVAGDFLDLRSWGSFLRQASLGRTHPPFRGRHSTQPAR